MSKPKFSLFPGLPLTPPALLFINIAQTPQTERQSGVPERLVLELEHAKPDTIFNLCPESLHFPTPDAMVAGGLRHHKSSPRTPTGSAVASVHRWTMGKSLIVSRLVVRFAVRRGRDRGKIRMGKLHSSGIIGFNYISNIFIHFGCVIWLVAGFSIKPLLKPLPPARTLRHIVSHSLQGEQNGFGMPFCQPWSRAWAPWYVCGVSVAFMLCSWSSFARNSGKRDYLTTVTGGRELGDYGIDECR